MPGLNDLPGLPDLAPVVAEQRHPLLFATVSGAHLYGFPSRDSDVDVRGVHVLPLRDVIGLAPGPETVTRTWDRDGVELDLVTHDLTKFARMLLRPNGYVLEQLLSPLVAHTTPEHAALVGLAPGLLTRHHARHYRGFSRTQQRMFDKTGELKPLLNVFRVLLTGLRLLRERDVVAHLPTLIDEPGRRGEAPAYLRDLVRAKSAAEHGLLDEVAGAPTRERIAADVARLHAALDEAEGATALPAKPRGAHALDEVVVAVRLGW
ncbi:nucleotidyltransferase [Streptomyces sp. PT12]|nr:nucleotidyltransferase [Streptomyces sp. PT12]